MVLWLHTLGQSIMVAGAVEGEKLLHLPADREQREGGADWGSNITSEVTSPVTYFLQLGTTSQSFYSLLKLCHQMETKHSKHDISYSNYNSILHIMFSLPPTLSLSASLFSSLPLSFSSPSPLPLLLSLLFSLHLSSLSSPPISSPYLSIYLSIISWNFFPSVYFPLFGFPCIIIYINPTIY
jgi:hypothetical protein